MNPRFDLDEEEMMDWLNQQLLQGGTVTFRAIRDSGGDDRDSLRFRSGVRVELFTVASQFTYGRTATQAIVNAVAIAGGYIPTPLAPRATTTDGGPR